MAPPSAAMRPAAAMSHSDRPRHWTKAPKRPLPTHARPSAALPMERGTRTALRTASSRRAKPLGGRAMEMTPSTRSPSKARDGPAVQLRALAEHGAEQVAAHRVHHRAHGRPATHDQRHAGAEVGDAGRVVDRAVEGVDDPDAVARIHRARWRRSHRRDPLPRATAEWPDSSARMWSSGKRPPDGRDDRRPRTGGRPRSRRPGRSS